MRIMKLRVKENKRGVSKWNLKNSMERPLLFCWSGWGEFAAAPHGRICRPAPSRSEGLDRSLLESPPDFLPTVAPVRVRFLYSTQEKKKCPFVVVLC